MIFTGLFMNFIDGGALDSEEEPKCSDYVLSTIIVFGICITIPLDIATSPLQLIGYGLYKAGKYIFR